MPPLKILIPKGKLYAKVIALLNEAGYGIEADERVYIPRVADPEISAKLIKPQNIPALIELGTHDIGFTGLDWVAESGVDVEEVLDLGFDPVRLVAAASSNESAESLGKRRIIVASEYVNLSRKYLEGEGYDFILLRTFGATEVFPPDDADMIVDNMASGRTLERNNLQVIATLLASSTRFIANRRSLEDPWRLRKIEEMKTLFESVLFARDRVMLEMNIPADRFAAIVDTLPCMRAPTVAPLHGNQGFAVKIAVLKKEAATLILKLKRMGASDILETEFRKVVL